MVFAPYKIVTSIGDNQWDDFVTHHPQGNIFQTPHMYEVYRKTRNYYPFKIFAVNQIDGQLSGVLSSVIINETGGFLGPFSTHSIIQGGPLVSPGQERALIPLLMAEHDKLTAKKALYSEIRNMYDVKKYFQGIKDYIYEDHLNIMIGLDHPIEVIWHQLHRAKKNHINRAQKLNVVIEELRSRDQMDLFYQLVKETYQNAKIPLAHISLFESAYDVLFPLGMVKYLLAKYQNQYIAGQVFLLFNNTLYAWYLGASKEYLNYHANEYITWHTLEWGKANGYKTFDFGGAGQPNDKYGPRNYKREFGGEEVNFGRHKNIYKPFEMKITDIGFKIYQKLLVKMIG